MAQQGGEISPPEAPATDPSKFFRHDGKPLVFWFSDNLYHVQDTVQKIHKCNEHGGNIQQLNHDANVDYFISGSALTDEELEHTRAFGTNKPCLRWSWYEQCIDQQRLVDIKQEHIIWSPPPPPTSSMDFDPSVPPPEPSNIPPTPPKIFQRDGKPLRVWFSDGLIFDRFAQIEKYSDYGGTVSSHDDDHDKIDYCIFEHPLQQQDELNRVKIWGKPCLWWDWVDECLKEERLVDVEPQYVLWEPNQETGDGPRDPSNGDKVQHQPSSDVVPLQLPAASNNEASSDMSMSLSPTSVPMDITPATGDSIILPPPETQLESTPPSIFPPRLLTPDSPVHNPQSNPLSRILASPTPNPSNDPSHGLNGTHNIEEPKHKSASPPPPPPSHTRFFEQDQRSLRLWFTEDLFRTLESVQCCSDYGVLRKTEINAGVDYCIFPNAHIIPIINIMQAQAWGITSLRINWYEECIASTRLVDIRPEHILWEPDHDQSSKGGYNGVFRTTRESSGFLSAPEAPMRFPDLVPIPRDVPVEEAGSGNGMMEEVSEHEHEHGEEHEREGEAPMSPPLVIEHEHEHEEPVEESDGDDEDGEDEYAGPSSGKQRRQREKLHRYTADEELAMARHFENYAESGLSGPRLWKIFTELPTNERGGAPKRKAEALVQHWGRHRDRMKNRLRETEAREALEAMAGTAPNDTAGSSRTSSVDPEASMGVVLSQYTMPYRGGIKRVEEWSGPQGKRRRVTLVTSKSMGSSGTFGDGTDEPPPKRHHTDSSSSSKRSSSSNPTLILHPPTQPSSALPPSTPQHSSLPSTLPTPPTIPRIISRGISPPTSTDSPMESPHQSLPPVPETGSVPRAHFTPPPGMTSSPARTSVPYSSLRLIAVPIDSNSTGTTETSSSRWETASPPRFMGANGVNELVSLMEGRPRSAIDSSELLASVKTLPPLKGDPSRITRFTYGERCRLLAFVASDRYRNGNYTAWMEYHTQQQANAPKDRKYYTLDNLLDYYELESDRIDSFIERMKDGYTLKPPSGPEHFGIQDLAVLVEFLGSLESPEIRKDAIRDSLGWRNFAKSTQHSTLSWLLMYMSNAPFFDELLRWAEEVI